MLKLVKLSKKYLPAVIKVIDEYKTDKNPYKVADIKALIEAIDNGTSLAWLEQKQNEDKGINLKPGYVSSTYYLLMEDKEYVGSFQLRHKLTENLMKIGGNIGYMILPSKRGKGYASAGLSLCLKEAKKLGLERVLITCDSSNAASHAVIIKAMQKYGGEILPDIQIDDGFEHRVWVNTIV